MQAQDNPDTNGGEPASDLLTPEDLLSAFDQPDGTSGTEEETGYQPSPEDVEWLEANLPLLQQLEGPGVTGGIERILEELLGPPIDTRTLDRMRTMLSTWAGTAVADVLLPLLLRGSRVPDFRDYVLEQLEPAQQAWLRLLFAIYSERLGEVLVVGDEVPEDWRALRHNIFYNLYGDNWWIDLTVARYDGVEFTLKTTPASLLNLAGGIVEVLLDLPGEGEGAGNALDPVAVQEVLGRCARLLEQSTPDADTETGTEGDESD